MTDLKLVVDYLNELQPDKNVYYGIEKLNGCKVTKWIKSEVTELAIKDVKMELQSLYLARMTSERGVVVLLANWDVPESETEN